MRPLGLWRIAGWLCLAAMLALASPGVRIARLAGPDPEAPAAAAQDPRPVSGPASPRGGARRGGVS